MRPIDIFHIGPQKTATAWLYRAFAEHPSIACANTDEIHYFDIRYSQGRNWYTRQFEGSSDDQVRADFTSSYIRSPWAAERMSSENPNARIILCLRHPVDRAYSHYWHERKKGTIRFHFDDVLENYDLFSSWIEPGFYARHLERYLQYFEVSQILTQRFELLAENPAAFLHQAMTFVGVRSSFEPTTLDRRVNAAGAKRDIWNLSKAGVNRLGRRVARGTWQRFDLERRLSGREEYIRGMREETRAALLEVCAPETDRLESLLGLDFSSWRE